MDKHGRFLRLREAERPPADQRNHHEWNLAHNSLGRHSCPIEVAESIVTSCGGIRKSAIAESFGRCIKTQQFASVVIPTRRLRSSACSTGKSHRRSCDVAVADRKVPHIHQR